jgi:hypothetical protein
MAGTKAKHMEHTARTGESLLQTRFITAHNSTERAMSTNKNNTELNERITELCLVFVLR